VSADALVFDLGGVLVDVDFQRALASWAAAAGVPPAALAARFRVDEPYCAHERGELDDRGYFEHLSRALGVSLAEEHWLAGWNATIGTPLPGIGPLVGYLARQRPLYVFSNTNPAHIAHFTPRLSTLLSHFRRTFTSCELGARKPEVEAFARLASAIGARPERLVFFDDVQENVAGARRAGLQAFHVRRADDIAAIAGDLLQLNAAS
jgi:putative hydrolase of the HAD superfamily